MKREREGNVIMESIATVVGGGGRKNEKEKSNKTLSKVMFILGYTITGFQMVK